MRIPLDYYRILGLPLQATADQLQQAHRDRVQQLPRREFSDVAITARKQLIDQAYSVLSDPLSRQDYDASFFAKSYDLMDVGRSEGLEEEIDAAPREGLDPQLGVDPYTPSIEIEESQFIGALLTLLELGEYELVLRLGRPHLSNNFQILKNSELGDPEIVAADIVLTIALAYLELGREQWQQGQYESAAASLEGGQELLLREGIFPNIRGEMQSDLFKLRPYRILELVSLPDSQEEARRQGISLLEDMLHDRNGIDGNGDDLSGLEVDDFLRFIQQLRSYLTAAEQQVLFESEARRPSGVAIYLAVYALLARGFAQRQPALIRRAKMLLLRLGSQQDVHLEQAVCSLLLGQTEEASRALELSQEFESLSFIRDHSQGSPDLLPGLCLYSERWFQNEVFPHFRDLQNRQASLTEYFADEDVQLYLEDLPTETESTPASWSTPTAQPASTPTRRSVNLPSDDRAQIGTQTAVPAYQGPSTATIEAPSYSNSMIVDKEPLGQTADTIGTADRGSNGRSTRPPSNQESVRSPQPNGSRPVGAIRRSLGRSNLRLDRIMLLAALGLLGIMLLGFLFGKLLNRPQPNSAAASANPNQVAPAETGLEDFIASQKQAIVASAPLTEENAPEIIRSWLAVKAAALGENHAIDQLEQILVDPALAQQQARAEDFKESNAYWKFEHSNIEVISVQTSGETATGSDNSTSEDSASEDSTSADSTTQDRDSDQSEEDATDASSPSDAADTAQSATIEAIISEKAEFYTDGEIDTTASYDSTVRVQYDLVREENQWRIRDMAVLE